MTTQTLPKLETAIETNESASDISVLKTLSMPNGQKSIPTPYVYEIERRSLNSIERQFVTECVGYQDIDGKELPSGAEIFSSIESHPDYYVGSAEENLLSENSFVDLPDDSIITEFGPGDGQKSKLIFEGNGESSGLKYQAIDVSSDFLRMTSNKISSFSNLREAPVTLCDDFFVASHGFERANVGLFLGTTISNFNPEDGLTLLRHLRTSFMKERGVLYLGQDGNHNSETLEYCYDDRSKYTAMFVMNSLIQLRRDCAPDLDLNSFSYKAFFDNHEQVMRMGVLSERDQIINFHGEQIAFMDGEFIQVGQSRKYSADTIHDMAREVGYEVEGVISSPENVNIHKLRVMGGLGR